MACRRRNAACSSKRAASVRHSRLSRPRPSRSASPLPFARWRDGLHHRDVAAESNGRNPDERARRFRVRRRGQLVKKPLALTSRDRDFVCSARMGRGMKSQPVGSKAECDPHHSALRQNVPRLGVRVERVVCRFGVSDSIRRLARARVGRLGGCALSSAAPPHSVPSSFEARGLGAGGARD